MLANFRKTRFISLLLSVAVLSFSFQPLANAAIIGTDDIVVEQQSSINRNALITALDRQDVKQALIQNGVDPVLAKQRVASMTDEEVIALNQKIDELPAGSGALGTVVFVFLVLLVTDILGYTDIFPFVKKTAK